MIIDIKKISFVLACIIIGIAASVWVVNLNFVIDSDVSNSAIVWHEISKNGWSIIKKWRATPDNWYFTVYPIHFLLFKLTGSTSPEILRFLAMAQLFICATLVSLICFERSKNCLSFILIPLLCGLSNYALNMGFVAHPFSHNTTNLYGLLCIYLYVLNAKYRSVIIDIFIYLLISIASISDPWLLAAFYLPFLFATCYEIVRFKTRSFKALFIPILTGGVLLFSRLIEYIFRFPGAGFRLGSIEQVTSNFQWFLYDFGGLINIFPIERNWSFNLSAIIIIIAYLFSISIPRRMNSVDFLILMSIAGITSAFVLSGTPGAADSARFFVNILYLTVGAIFLRALSDRKILFIPLIMFLVSNITSNILYLPAIKRSSSSADLITFMNDNNLHYGFGPYWGTQALATSWLSNWQQVIRPVSFDKTTGYVKLSGRAQTFDNWYNVNSDNPRKREFVAIVNDGEECQNINLCLNGVKQQFGEPDQIINFNKITFYIYNSQLILKISTAH